MAEMPRTIEFRFAPPTHETVREPSRSQADGTSTWPALPPKMDRLDAYRLACERRGRKLWPLPPAFWPRFAERVS